MPRKGTKMHQPLQHAADTILQRQAGKTLSEWLTEQGDTPGTLLAVRLAAATNEVIIIDKRTAEKWREDNA